MIEPNQDLLDHAKKIPTITLDDVEWPVPKFSPKQNEIIVPLVLELAPQVINVMGGEEDGKLERLAAILTGENYRKMNDVIYTALTKGHSTLTRKEYDEVMVVGTTDMIQSFMVIARQTGLIRIVPVGAVPEAANPGEE